MWQKAANTSVDAYSGAGGDGSGHIHAEDYVIWRSNFGNTIDSGIVTSNTVPKPVSICLLFIGPSAEPLSATVTETATVIADVCSICLVVRRCRVALKVLTTHRCGKRSLIPYLTDFVSLGFAIADSR